MPKLFILENFRVQIRIREIVIIFSLQHAPKLQVDTQATSLGQAHTGHITLVQASGQGDHIYPYPKPLRALEKESNCGGLSHLSRVLMQRSPAQAMG